MSQELKFTEEAVNVYNGYIEELESGLQQTDLSPSDVDTAISEVKQHIQEFCEIKAHNGIITTDMVNQAIHKLGKPNMIIDAYVSEKEVSESVISQLAIQAQKKTRSIDFKAYHVANIFSASCWLLTSSLIFYLFGFDWMEYSIAAFLSLSTILLMTIYNLDSYPHNSYLQETVTLNIHLFLSPLVFIGFYPFHTGFSISFVYPLVIILWMYLLSSKPAKSQIKHWYHEFNEFRSNI